MQHSLALWQVQPAHSTAGLQAKVFTAAALTARLLLCRILLTAYAAYLQPPWFREEAYLWAVDLWYAYAIQVRRCSKQQQVVARMALLT